MSNGNSRFDAAAAAWDSNPSVHRASASALESILQHFPELQTHQNNASKNNNTGLDVLEIGCGTGLLSFMIAPYVRSLVAVDTSQGMIDALKIKLENAPKVQNILPVCAMLEDRDDPKIRLDPVSKRAPTDQDVNELSPRRFDLVISHLVLHHIPSLESMFSTMYGCLKTGGRIALSDFEDFGPEARKFHPEAMMEGVERHGIKRDLVKQQLMAAGFENVKIDTAFEMEKGVETNPGEGIVKGEKGSRMVFPFLICTATRA